MQYQTFLPLPNSRGANPFSLSSLSSSINLGPSFHNIEKEVFNCWKNLKAVWYSLWLDLSNPIITWFKNWVLFISLIILGSAVPFISENNEGSINSIGLSFEKLTKSFSSFL